MFKDAIKKFKLKTAELNEISKSGSIKNSRLPAKIKKIFRTAHDISPEWHIKIQSAFQKYTDNAVSKTVNIPENSTIEDIKDVFIKAYRLKCKGLTIYRYNSKPSQVLEFCKKCEEKK
jgi:ribonucleoside-diphosphate reductase alpha chain